MAAKVRRGEQLLQRFSEAMGISEDGRKWIIVACDPFHDTDVDCRGYPDDNTAASVVQCVKTNITLSAGTGISAGENWDLHLVSAPFMEPITLTRVPIAGSVLTPASGSGDIDWGGITAVCVPAGTSSGFETIYGATEYVIGRTSIASSYFTGPSRVIAAGFEAINSTAAINAQGQAMVYRNPFPFHYPTTRQSTNGTTLNGSSTFIEAAFHPSNTNQASLLCGTRQWHSKEGAYVPLTFNNVNIPSTGRSFSPPIYQSDVTTGFAYLPHYTTSGGVVNWPACYMAPLNQAGIYFTGLSYQSTVTLTLNVWIERFPDVEETDLIPLAKPSPVYDAKALELYSRLVADMPPGVPAKENGLGDWFSGIVKGLTSAATMIPHPIAQVVAGAGRAITTVTDAFPSRPPPQRSAPRQALYQYSTPPSPQAAVSTSSDRRSSRAPREERRSTRQPRQPKRRAKRRSHSAEPRHRRR